MDTINSAQVLFGAFFAIYYSLMLDRANNEYRPFDTYSAWRGSPHARTDQLDEEVRST